jgi:hypothetical protein
MTPPKEGERKMAGGKPSAKLEKWLTDLRVLIMWALRDEERSMQ